MCQRTINRRPPDIEGLGNIGWPHALSHYLAHPVGVDRSGPPLVDTGGLGLGDALELPLTTEIGLELREHAEHVQEAFAGGRAGVDRLLRCSEARTLRFERADDVLQIADRTCQAVDPGAARRLGSTGS
jgi:hypothetical protein